jgi:hypothetical protein
VTPRRLAAVILAALFPAWPLPAFTPVTVPDTQVTAVTAANQALQTAIQNFAANPSATNAALLTTAQSNYNTAVSAASPPHWKHGCERQNRPIIHYRSGLRFADFRGCPVRNAHVRNAPVRPPARHQ